MRRIDRTTHKTARPEGHFPGLRGSAHFARRFMKFDLDLIRETAGPMIELAYGIGRMSSINRAGAQVVEHPSALRPSSKTLPSERSPGHMMPRAERILLRPVTTAPATATRSRGGR